MKGWEHLVDIGSQADDAMAMTSLLGIDTGEKEQDMKCLSWYLHTIMV